MMTSRATHLAAVLWLAAAAVTAQPAPEPAW